MKKIYGILFLFLMLACHKAEQTQEIWIKNPQNESIYIQVDGLENAAHSKLAIVQHGLASNMKHRVVQTVKKAFLDNNYVVITFDTRHSLGKSDNEVEKVRFSTFGTDLENVAEWAKTQSFYHEPFALSGHSLGGASVINYASLYPEKVNILIPVSPVVSGQLWEKSCMKNMSAFCQNWKQNGMYEYTDKEQLKTVQIPYRVVTSSMTYDAYKLMPRIKAETLLITAQNDIVIQPEDVVNLSTLIQNGYVEIIPFSGHNFEQKQNQTDLYQTINLFLKQQKRNPPA